MSYESLTYFRAVLYESEKCDILTELYLILSYFFANFFLTTSVVYFKQDDKLYSDGCFITFANN